MTYWGLLSSIAAGIIFGIVARIVATLTCAIGTSFKTKIYYPPFRPAIGGVLIAIGIGIVGNTKYIGLGISSIVSTFQTQLPPWDFADKIGFTSLTLGSDFKGRSNYLAYPPGFMPQLPGSVVSHQDIQVSIAPRGLARANRSPSNIKKG